MCLFFPGLCPKLTLYTRELEEERERMWCVCVCMCACVCVWYVYVYSPNSISQSEYKTNSRYKAYRIAELFERKKKESRKKNILRTFPNQLNSFVPYYVPSSLVLPSLITSKSDFSKSLLSIKNNLKCHFLKFIYLNNHRLSKSML